jgi:alginate O-acetyltransferase complex protein AlgI
MLFNTIAFALFFLVVLGLYWLIGQNRIQAQNVFLIVASYFFYAQWDWRFLVLIFISTLLDYVVGLGFTKASSPPRRKLLLWVSIVGNLGILFYFKYFNFFVDGFLAMFASFGIDIQYATASIILPVGISFYTFQTLSYTIDIYRERLKPTTDFIAFAAFVSFFPQLVAGPIERARNLLPQFTSSRMVKSDQLMEGFELILWGLFKKLVIADNVALFVNRIYGESDSLGGSTLFVGAILFMIQLYLDFSAYSDIAIGVSRFFGIRLMRNFAYPYFSRDVAETWSRWHISLTTWFRDYLFVPLTLGKSDSLWWKFVAVLIVFGLCGLWHGAAWNFVTWGLLFAVMYAKHIFFKRKTPRTAIVAEGKLLPSLTELRQMVFTFLAVTIPCIFFRAQSFEQGMDFIWGFLSASMFEIPTIHPDRALTLLIVGFFAIEWVGRNHWSPLTYFQKYPFWVQWGVYQVVIALTWYYRAMEKSDFIYFQF